MVFCYKLITETPRRSGATSPVKRSVVTNDPSSISQLIKSFDYDGSEVLGDIPEHDWRLLATLARKREVDDERERLADQFRKMWQKEKQEREMLIKSFDYDGSDVVGDIPEHDWRLLTTLARKREVDDERERLTDQFRKMWQKEKQEREMVEAETLAQYRRYLHNKRQEERTWQEFRQMQKSLEQHIRKGEILDCIRHKEERSAMLLAHVDDKKATEIVDKVLEDQARAQLAADRRSRLDIAQECRRVLELADAERRANEALRRRNAKLRDASQRVAISNALSHWETALLRQEVTALDSARRASHAARAALVDARSTRLARAREIRVRRARKVAAITAQMRDAIRSGRT